MPPRVQFTRNHSGRYMYAVCAACGAPLVASEEERLRDEVVPCPCGAQYRICVEDEE